MHWEVGFVTTDYKMRRTILFGNICQFKDDAHHSSVDLFVVDAIPEDRICLFRSTTVEFTVPLPFFAPGRVAVL